MPKSADALFFDKLVADAGVKPNTKAKRVYDILTSESFMLKRNPLKLSAFDRSAACCSAASMDIRTDSNGFKRFAVD